MYIYIILYIIMLYCPVHTPHSVPTSCTVHRLVHTPHSVPTSCTVHRLVHAPHSVPTSCTVHRLVHTSHSVPTSCTVHRLVNANRYTFSILLEVLLRKRRIICPYKVICLHVCIHFHLRMPTPKPTGSMCT